MFSTFTLAAAPAPSALQMARQRELRGEHGQLAARVAVVRALDVAPLLALQVQAGELRLELEHRSRALGSEPDVGELRADMLDVRRPQLHGGVARVEVPLAVGQPEPGLDQPQQVAVGVVVIDGHAPAEQREDPRAMQRRQQRQHRPLVLRALDLPQQRRDRLQPGRFDRVEIQPGGERVAERDPLASRPRVRAARAARARCAG